MIWGLLITLIISVSGNVVLSILLYKWITRNAEEVHRGSASVGKAHSYKTNHLRVISPYKNKTER